jgi:hypothetical protein
MGSSVGVGIKEGASADGIRSWRSLAGEAQALPDDARNKTKEGSALGRKWKKGSALNT